MKIHRLGAGGYEEESSQSPRGRERQLVELDAEARAPPGNTHRKPESFVFTPIFSIVSLPRTFPR